MIKEMCDLEEENDGFHRGSRPCNRSGRMWRRRRQRQKDGGETTSAGAEKSMRKIVPAVMEKIWRELAALN